MHRFPRRRVSETGSSPSFHSVSIWVSLLPVLRRCRPWLNQYVMISARTAADARMDRIQVLFGRARVPRDGAGQAVGLCLADDHHHVSCACAIVSITRFRE